MRQALQVALAAARTLPAEELPRLLGDLEEIKCVALGRLAAPVAVEAPAALPEVLDVDQAAKYTNMSAKWLYKNLGAVPHLRIGNGRKKPRVRFRRKDLAAWLEEHRTTLRRS